MNEKEFRRGEIITWITVIGVGILFPLSAPLLGHWLFHVSLPTLLFISFVLLYVGSFFAYPVVPEEPPSMTEPSDNTRSIGAILLIAGHASGLGVLILYFIRLYSQGVEHFSWM
jgi:hypothetical protein